MQFKKSTTCTYLVHFRHVNGVFSKSVLHILKIKYEYMIKLRRNFQKSTSLTAILEENNWGRKNK